jgi:hypothetical protein
LYPRLREKFARVNPLVTCWGRLLVDHPFFCIKKYTNQFLRFITGSKRGEEEGREKEGKKEEGQKEGREKEGRGRGERERGERKRGERKRSE